MLGPLLQTSGLRVMGDKPAPLTLGNWFMMFQQSPDLRPRLLDPHRTCSSPWNLLSKGPSVIILITVSFYTSEQDTGLQV